MISLLFAGYMAGLAALAAPIVLHLMRRRPRQLLAFPSFMFLVEVKHQSEDRSNLKRWLLLLLRCLLLLLLALAFSWPYLAGDDERAQRATVVLVDQSYSMLAEPYREELRNRAEAVIGEAAKGEPIMVGLVTDQTSWSGEFTEESAPLLETLRKARPPAGTSAFEQSLRRADALLAEYPAENRRIVLITDKQLTPWRDVRLNRTLSPGVALEIVGPEKPGFRNVGLGPPMVRGSLTREGQTMRVDVSVRSFMDQKMTARLVVELDDQSVADSEIQVEPFDTATIRVELKNLAHRPHAGRVRLIVEDELAADNQAYFVVNPSEPQRIGLVGVDSTLGKFIGLALDPTQTGRDATFVEVGGKDDTRKLALVVLCRGPRDAAAEAAVQRHLDAGGTVAAVWADAELRQWLARHEVMPGTDSKRGRHKFDTVDFHHPLFDVFLTGRVGSLFGVLFLDLPAVDFPPRAEVLARFDNGRPAVVEMNVSAGRLIVIAHPLSREQTNWPVHATFLPFWRQLLAYASADAASAHMLTVQSTPVVLDGAANVRGPEDKEPRPVEAGRLIADAPGVYQAMDHDNRTTLYAANVPLTEGDATAIHEAFGTARLVSTETAQEQELPVATDRAGAESAGHSYWWELMAVAVCLMIAELYLANRTQLN